MTTRSLRLSDVVIALFISFVPSLANPVLLALGTKVGAISIQGCSRLRLRSSVENQNTDSNSRS